MSDKRKEEPYSNVDEAVQYLTTRQKEGILRYYSLYGAEIEDFNNYDLVVDSSRLTVDEAVETIISKIKIELI